MRKMTLESVYSAAKKTYADKYGENSWEWQDEGSINAIMDFFSHCGELTEEDALFAFRNKLVDDCVWCVEDDTGRVIGKIDFEIRRDVEDNGDTVYDVYEHLCGPEYLTSFKTYEECERFVATEIVKMLNGEERTV